MSDRCTIPCKKAVATAFLLVGLVLSARYAGAWEDEAHSPKLEVPRPFNLATELGTVPPEDSEAVGFRFSMSGSVFQIAYSGKGKRTDTRGNTLDFRLDPDSNEGAYLVRVYFTNFSGDIVMACESSDSDYGWGFLVRLDGKSLKTKWRATIPSFNVGRGLIEGQYAYLTCLGFVAKLDLDSGTYIWRNDHLYVGIESAPRGRCCHFNAFGTPKLDGDTVIFNPNSQIEGHCSVPIR